MFSKVREYIKDLEFRLILFEDRLLAVNYDSILSLESDTISFLVSNKKIIIKGKELTLSRLLEKEVLIGGEVINIEVFYE